MEKKDGPFSPFEPITIILLMSPPNMHFINLPLSVSIFLKSLKKVQMSSDSRPLRCGTQALAAN